MLLAVFHFIRIFGLVEEEGQPVIQCNLLRPWVPPPDFFSFFLSPMRLKFGLKIVR